MDIAIGLAEIFAYWAFLYWLAGEKFAALWLTLYEWAQEVVDEFEGR